MIRAIIDRAVESSIVDTRGEYALESAGADSGHFVSGSALQSQT
jgi:hypothetical protein